MCKSVFQPSEDTAFRRDVSSDCCRLPTNALCCKTKLVLDARAHGFWPLVAFSKLLAINTLILKCKIPLSEMTYPQETR